MEIDFVKLMTSKSDEELQEYIDNRIKYNPNAVFEAINEFKKRGKTFTELEIETIKADIAKNQELSKQRVDDAEFGLHKWDKKAVEGIEAPELYSQRVIYSFSIFFGVVFGAILMAINLNKTEKKNRKLEVIAFGIIYTGLQIWLLSFIPRNTGLSLIFNIGGAFILNSFFWKKYIGLETEYRKKKFLIPLLIGIGLFIIYFLAIFSTQ